MTTISQFIEARMETGEYKRQYELAMELDMNSAQLSHYHTNRSKQPTLTVAVKIYKAYEVVLWPYDKGAIYELSER